ncbi:uncharacterized protein LOC116130663 [Pistacia vera]|uniref:uncharacterized protein LOC116130663 n=1 Tax=Pistacia vera TaxID=55513 RepID=UPI00126387AA|nr:uncharacterized protein LOC116130663 [Pistacia vera]
MAHPDHETRVGAHSVFSVVLMSSLVSPWMKVGGLQEESRVPDVNVKHSHSQSYSFKCALTNGKTITSFRLSSHQVSVLLSSIWVQATSAENNPANFEAMAHTYTIALLFMQFKTSSHMALVRCFQLAFSLRCISLDQEV